MTQLWPQNKYRSTWPIFHGLVILLNIFKIIWWMNIIVGIIDQCDTNIVLIMLCRSATLFYGPVILLQISKTIWWRNVVLGINESVWHKDWPCKIYVGQWPIFHVPLILPFYHCHWLTLFLYIKKWCRPGVFVPMRALALVYFAWPWTFYSNLEENMSTQSAILFYWS